MKEKYVYICSGIVLIIASFFSVGYHQLDEHYQLLEFAGLKLNITPANDLPWEYHAQMRPAIQPAIAVLITDFFHHAGISNPFTIVFFMRLLSAALAFLGMYLIYQTYIKNITDYTLKKWFLFLSFFLWFMIYNNVRFSSENWSGTIFLIAFSLLNNKSLKPISYLYIGMLFGLSFIFRYQCGFLIGGLILWQIFFAKNKTNTVLLILGILLSTGIGVLIDRWFYETWTFTSWHYLDQNILQNKVSEFGTDPWWYYAQDVFLQAAPPFSILYIASFLIVFIFMRKDILTWTVFPYLFIHCIIGHKELRFLFPIIGFVPIVIIKSIEIIQMKWNKKFVDYRACRIVVKLFLVVNSVFLITIAAKPANNIIPLFHTIYSEYNEPVKLYYVDELLYIHIHYYKRDNMEIVKLKSIDEIPHDHSAKQLFITNNEAILNEIKGTKTLKYAAYPAWIMRFNFNHWVERSRGYSLYELN